MDDNLAVWEGSWYTLFEAVNKEEKMSLFGPPNVSKMRAKGDVDGLIEALGYERDPGLQQAAAEALVEIGPPAVGLLVDAIESKGIFWPGRGKAAIVLAQRGDTHAVEVLISDIKEPHENARQAAAEALRQLIDIKVTEPLVAAVKLGDLPASLTAARALQPLIAGLEGEMCDYPRIYHSPIGLGLIVHHPSGVLYGNQVGGFTCHQRWIEGVYVPISEEPHGLGWQLSDIFAGHEWKEVECPWVDPEIAYYVDQVLSSNCPTASLRVDRSRLQDSEEAWIYVTIEPAKDDRGDPVRDSSGNQIFSGGSHFFGFHTNVGVLTWQNSD